MNISKILQLHFRSLTCEIKNIIKRPAEHLFNIMAIALVITTMGGILILNQNITKWQNRNLLFPQIIIYLSDEANQADVTKIQTNINRYDIRLIKNYQFISKEQGLNNLTQDQNLKSIVSENINIGNKNSNPLPNILIINTNSANKLLLKQLVNKIRTYAIVDSVQMDEDYANKINNLTDFIKKIFLILQILFVLLLVLVIYNLVRLQMFTRKDEIIISRLIGASDSFIMRPLTYYAIIQTTISAIIAYIFINYFITYLNNLFLGLSNLFGQRFILEPLNNLDLLQMLLILVVFTIFSVFIAVRIVFKKNYNN